MTKSELNTVAVIQSYKEGASTYDIAKEYGTNPNRIRRLLKREGVKLRSKSDAQKNAIATGKVEHPTKGKKRTKEERLAISSSAVRYWNDMSDKEREKRRKQAEENWKKMSPAQREAMQKKGNAEIRKAAIKGSKLEREVQKFVAGAGYRFQAHKKDLIPQKNYEIDLYIPELRTIIEVDGLSHFAPIWGEEALRKQEGFDAEKDGVLLTKGFQLIRIENLSSSMALSKLAKLEEELVKVLTEISEGTIDSQLKVIKYE